MVKYLIYPIIKCSLDQVPPRIRESETIQTTKAVHLSVSAVSAIIRRNYSEEVFGERKQVVAFGRYNFNCRHQQKLKNLEQFHAELVILDSNAYWDKEVGTSGT